jgi:quercetin dioxygenase-like cupin family protein
MYRTRSLSSETIGRRLIPMIEKAYEMAATNEKTVKKVILDENLQYIQMVFPKDEGLPEHISNANVYMTVVRGTLSISLEDQETHAYPAGTVVKIPRGTRMNVRNLNEAVLELIVVKAPAPRD